MPVIFETREGLDDICFGCLQERRLHENEWDGSHCREFIMQEDVESAYFDKLFAGCADPALEVIVEMLRKAAGLPEILLPGMVPAAVESGVDPSNAIKILREQGSGFVCPTCRSAGFTMSKLGPTRCTFCDGTEGGNPPQVDIGEQVAQELHAEQERAEQARALESNVDLLDLDEPDLIHEETRSREDDGPTFEVVMGSAGTGKTYLMKDRQKKTRGTVLCATTGIAAINLGGTTINALLGYYDTKSLQEVMLNGFLQGRLRKLRASEITRYVIDEVSMLDGNALDILVQAIEEVNDARVSEYDREVKLTLVGDFAQLPPVKAPFAFHSRSWEKFEKNQTVLTEIRRQSDKDFILALQAARKGDGEKALEYFRDKMVQTKDDEFQGPTILAMNQEVDRYNRLKLTACDGEEICLLNTKEGRQRGEWKNIPDRIDLKIGAQVMVLANKRDVETREYLYVNGDLGELVGIDDEGEQAYPIVKLHRTGFEEKVQPVQRDFLVPTGNTGARKDRFIVEGTITYYPLRLAYASTVHKTQGLSLDRVQVSIANHFFSNPGSVYVALSRARTPEGLRLVGTPEMFIQRCNADPKVKRFL